MRLSAALLLAALVATPAVAAPAKPAKPSCNMVTDPSGDATGLAAGVASPRNDDGMDLVSIDFATNTKDLTLLSRMYALSSVDTMAPTGRELTVTVTVRKADYTVRVQLLANGQVRSEPSAAVTLDQTAFQLRMTVSLASLGIKGLTAKDRFTRLRVTTQRWDETTNAAVGDVVDSAEAAISYPHTGRSCVRVGA